MDFFVCNPPPHSEAPVSWKEMVYGRQPREAALVPKGDCRNISPTRPSNVFHSFQVGPACRAHGPVGGGAEGFSGVEASQALWPGC